MAQYNIQQEFTNYGKNMQLVAIFMVLTIIPYISFIFSILMLVFIFMALGNLRNANYQLNSLNLSEHRSKYITAFILKLIGTLVMTASLPLALIPIMSSGYGYGSTWSIIIIMIIPLVIGFIFMIVGAIIEMGAWEQLRLFLEQDSKDLFPDFLKREAINGCNNLRTGALMYALSFLIVTILIGFIFQVIGFFKLAKFSQLPHLSQQVAVPPKPEQPTPVPEPVTPTKEEEKRFCPNCGAEIRGAGNFCAECGSPLK